MSSYLRSNLCTTLCHHDISPLCFCLDLSVFVLLFFFLVCVCARTGRRLRRRWRSCAAPPRPRPRHCALRGETSSVQPSRPAGAAPVAMEPEVVKPTVVEPAAGPVAAEEAVVVGAWSRAAKRRKRLSRRWPLLRRLHRLALELPLRFLLLRFLPLRFLSRYLPLPLPLRSPSCFWAGRRLWPRTDVPIFTTQPPGRRPGTNPLRLRRPLHNRRQRPRRQRLRLDLQLGLLLRREGAPGRASAASAVLLEATASAAALTVMTGAEPPSASETLSSSGPRARRASPRRGPGQSRANRRANQRANRRARRRRRATSGTRRWRPMSAPSSRVHLELM